MKKNIVLYHANCMDGLGAAWAAWKYLGDVNTTYIAVQYGDAPPDTTDMNVFILDFSYKLDVMIELIEKGNRVTVIDHHKTFEPIAIELMDFDNPMIYINFNPNSSGAVLSWEHFFFEETPVILQYIQDRDLWRWEMDKSKEVSAYLYLNCKTIAQLDEAIMVKRLDEIKQEGALILKVKDDEINSSCLPDKISRIDIAGFNVPITNCQSNISEVGNKLSVGEPFSVMYFDTPTKRVFSLRSQETGEDVSAIASKFGGGGHKCAAGFSIPLPTILP